MSLVNVAGTLWLVMAVCGADLYRDSDDDQVTLDLIYPDMNYIDTGVNGDLYAGSPPQEPRLGKLEERALLFHRMLAALRNRQSSPSVPPKWIPSDAVPALPDTFNFKTPMKRITGEEAKTRADAKPNPRPQPKWKIKKGKSGSPMLCYFKLCAFRPA